MRERACSALYRVPKKAGVITLFCLQHLLFQRILGRILVLLVATGILPTKVDAHQNAKDAAHRYATNKNQVARQIARAVVCTKDKSGDSTA